eukprot:1157224-Pelagomonas_calceolata.AAC.5
MWPGEKARAGASWPAPKRQTPVEALALRQHFSGETTTGRADHHRSAIFFANMMKDESATEGLAALRGPEGCRAFAN